MWLQVLLTTAKSNNCTSSATSKTINSAPAAALLHRYVSCSNRTCVATQRAHSELRIPQEPVISTARIMEQTGNQILILPAWPQAPIQVSSLRMQMVVFPLRQVAVVQIRPVFLQLPSKLQSPLKTQQAHKPS